MAASEDLHTFNELIADSDSDDDIPLAELRPLSYSRHQAANNDENNDGSTDTDQSQDPDVDVNNDEEELPAINIDFTTAYEHGWLGNFTKTHGHKLGAGAEDMCEMQVFLSLLTPDVLDLLVTETNRYAAQYFLTHPKDTLPPHSLARRWVDVDSPEMSAFLGILFFMGYVKLPTYLSYWSTDYLTEMRGFRTIMSRDRWHVIWQFFHSSNNDLALPRDHPQFDKIFKVRPLVEILLNKWQGGTTLGKICPSMKV